MIQQAPTESGWQRSTWTRELISLELEKRTGIGLSIKTIGRTLPKHQKAALTPGVNARRHVAGALDAATGRIVWVWGERRDSPLFIEHLRALVEAYPRARKIHLIVDNCSAHDSKATREAVKASELRPIVLHFLPPYCPFENRIEMLWEQLHANVTRNHTCRSIDELADRVDHFLTTAQPWPGAKPAIARQEEQAA